MTSEERAKRATELLFDLGRVPDTAKEREALLCVTKAALQPGARHQTIDGEWFRWLQDYLKGVFRPSDAPGRPDTPPKARTASSGAPSGFVGSVSVTGGGVNAIGSGESEYDAAIKRGEPLIAEAPVPDDESEPERTCGECAKHPDRCTLAGVGHIPGLAPSIDAMAPLCFQPKPEPERAFLTPDENREGNVCGDCSLCMDAPPGKGTEVCPLIDKKPAGGPGIIPPGNLVGDMKPEPKPERTCGEYRGGHYYEPCPPGDIACSGFKPKAERHPGYPVLVDWEDGRGPQRLGGMINFDRKPGLGEYRDRDWLTFEPGKIADVKILVD